MHINNGSCLSCSALFDKYPGFYQPLRDWFTALQQAHPETHISCGGRNEIDQNALYMKGATKAKWLESSHNFNAAIDVFFLINDQYNLDDSNFESIVVPALNDSLNWYGKPGCTFPEKPHIEPKGWTTMVYNKILSPVE